MLRKLVGINLSSLLGLAFIAAVLLANVVAANKEQRPNHTANATNNGQSSETTFTVTGDEGPLRIRITGIQNKQNTSDNSSWSAEIDSRSDEATAATTTTIVHKNRIRNDSSSASSTAPHLYPVFATAFVATTVAPNRELGASRDPNRQSSLSDDDEDEDDFLPQSGLESKTVETESDSISSSLGQLGQAIKLIGTLMSWSRAINPTEGQTRSAASMLGSVIGLVTGSEQLSKGLIGTARADSESQEQGRAATTDVAEGRYIKGDPLKGYYDFVITEGSYKFWAVFQLATAVLIIYSTCAAIYYSKVNPLISDYDYVDYFGGRSLGSGRSLSASDLDNTDVVDDDDDDENGSAATNRRNATESKSFLSGWSSMFEMGRKAKWLDTAASGFHFVLDAIDKIPQ